MFFFSVILSNIGFHTTRLLGIWFSLATAETVEVGGESDLPAYIIHGFFTLLKVNLTKFVRHEWLATMNHLGIYQHYFAMTYPKLQVCLCC